MRKTRILIASVLKPVNDTRMFEKVGQSLAKIPETEIHICGFTAKDISNAPSIRFHPIFAFRRLSFARIKAQWKYYKILLKLKPEVIIVNTYELLLVTLLYRTFYRTVILYDIRENYFDNIRFQPTFPKPLRWILANSVRMIEQAASPFISHFFLAEKSYARELSFIGQNYTVLENKYKPAPTFQNNKPTPVLLNKQNLNFLYSGTISEIYGIWEAISLIDKLYQLNNQIRLSIIGFCPQEETYQNLLENLENKPYIKLIGGKSLQPHQQIIAEIQKADIGLLPYQFNQSTANCLPTKLFEYLANCLPVIIPENPLWEVPVKRYTAGFSIDFKAADPALILNRITAETFYCNGLPQDVFWQTEEEKLVAYFSEKILKKQVIKL